MNKEDVKYLVFDVESIPDPKLIRMVRYSDEELDDAAAVKKFQGEILASTNGVSEFIPVTFQVPVSICIAKVREDFTLADVVSLDEPEFRPQRMVRLFWKGVEEQYDDASLVTFNGRGFDIPLLELMAYRYGLTVKRHFRDKFAGRYRYGTKHIDLQDWLSNYNAIRMNGGLDLLAKLLGKPGKMNSNGSMVYDMHCSGKMKEISEYCTHDVLDTYFVFLRTRVLLGEITVEREHDVVNQAKKFIIENQERIPAFKEYLDCWGEWIPWPVV